MNRGTQTPTHAGPPPALDGDAIHLWHARLDDHADSVSTLSRLLSGGEHDRAGRFHFERDRTRFIVRRAMLRLVLSAYLRQPAETLRFDVNSYGKPALRGSDAPLRFNMSDSHGLAVLAVTTGREIGVDIERVTEGPLEEGIAERFFAPAEVEALRRVPMALQRRAFFDCWTRKEAYIKAVGHGLSIALQSFEVSLAPGEPARLLGHAQAGEAARWGMASFEPAPDYAGCVCADAGPWLVTQQKWTP